MAGSPLAPKVKEVLKALNVTISGPVWQLIIKAAMVMINKAQVLQTVPISNIKQLVPLL